MIEVDENAPPPSSFSSQDPTSLITAEPTTTKRFSFDYDEQESLADAQKYAFCGGLNSFHIFATTASAELGPKSSSSATRKPGAPPPSGWKFSSAARQALAQWKDAFSSCHFRTSRRSKKPRDDKPARALPPLQPVAVRQTLLATNAAAPGNAAGTGGRRPAVQSQVMGTVAGSPDSQHASFISQMDDPALERVTQLPAGVEHREWLATHALALFEHVNALCGCLSEVCTPASCPHMSYPGTSKAHWTDERGRRQVYAAPRYTDAAMSLCEATNQNEAFFPTRYGSSWTEDFDAHCRQRFRLLWHCAGHLAERHLDHLAALNLQAHLALVLAHVHKISEAYGLLEPKDLQTLGDTVRKIRPVMVIPPAPIPAERKISQPAYLQSIISAAPRASTMHGGGGRATTTSVSTSYSGDMAAKSASWGGHASLVAVTQKPVVSPLT